MLKEVIIRANAWSSLLQTPLFCRSATTDLQTNPSTASCRRNELFLDRCLGEKVNDSTTFKSEALFVGIRHECFEGWPVIIEIEGIRIAEQCPPLVLVRREPD